MKTSTSRLLPDQHPHSINNSISIFSGFCSLHLRRPAALHHIPPLQLFQHILQLFKHVHYLAAAASSRRNCCRFRRPLGTLPLLVLQAPAP
jgi:hypothetical protein